MTKSSFGLILCAEKSQEQTELLELDKVIALLQVKRSKLSPWFSYKKRESARSALFNMNCVKIQIFQAVILAKSAW